MTPDAISPIVFNPYKYLIVKLEEEPEEKSRYTLFSVTSKAEIFSPTLCTVNILLASVQLRLPHKQEVIDKVVISVGRIISIEVKPVAKEEESSKGMVMVRVMLEASCNASWSSCDALAVRTQGVLIRVAFKVFSVWYPAVV